MELSRRLTVVVIALGATLLIVSGALAGVLIADGGNGGDRDGDRERERSSRPSRSDDGGNGYLGLTVSFAGAGALRVATVEADGPAAKAGVQVGDVLRSVDGRVVRTPEQLRRAVESKKPGDRVTLTYERGDRELQAQVQLSDAPANAQIEPRDDDPGRGGPQGSGRDFPGSRGRLGVSVQPITPALKQRYNLQQDAGVVVTEVAPGSAAAAAGLQAGDVLLSIGATAVSTVDEVQRALTAAPADQPVEVKLKRGGQDMTLQVTLQPEPLAGFQNLPPELQERLQGLLQQGRLSGEPWRQALRLAQSGADVVYGRVTEVNSEGVKVQILAGGTRQEKGFYFTADTAIRLRGGPIDLADIHLGDAILIASRDGLIALFAIDFGPAP